VLTFSTRRLSFIRILPIQLLCWAALAAVCVGQARLAQEPAGLPPGTTAKLWKGGIVEELSAAVRDGDEKTYVVLRAEKRESELSAGLEWSSNFKISGLKILFAALNGIAYEPLPDFQLLEFWDGRQWRSLKQSVRIDYSREGEMAAYQKSGSVVWDYSFDAIDAKGIRLTVSKTASAIGWRQQYVIREMKPYFSTTRVSPRSSVVVLGKAATRSLEEGQINWAARERGALRTQDSKGAVISWPQPMLVDQVVLPLKQWLGSLEWWDGVEWKPIEVTHLETDVSQPSNSARFLPLAIRKLRISNLPLTTPCQVYLSQFGQEYFERVYRSGRDLLMERILENREEPNFAIVASLLLPLDMQTGVIGRPGDPIECMVHWNGTLVEIEGGDKGDWNTGAKNSPPGKSEWIDRWMAVAANGELVGTNATNTSRSLLDGFLPAVVTRYLKDGILYEQEVLTTAPDDPVYAQLLTIRVSNPGKEAKTARLSVLLGRRKSAVAGHRKGQSGEAPGPMNFDPLATGYRTERDSQIVRNQSAEIILYSQTPFRWGGTSQENALSYESMIDSGQVKELHFVLPSVNGPVNDPGAVQRINVSESRERFRRYWRKTLEGTAHLDLPEPRLNDLVRNLLAQSLIVLRDRQELKYGAYWYEDYFGVEEGWPIVALAQYGHGNQAWSAIETMLSPELMDKSNYHHQYRNGLAPMYAAQVYRLTRDRQWLEKLKPRLVESAEWTISSRHERQGREEEFYGLLPKHAYGGDISTPAYSLYSNATCWRGLQDISSLMRDLGDVPLAERYQKDAGEYRYAIEQVVTRQTNQEVDPPFVPLAFDIGSAGSKDYRKVETPYSFIPSDPLGNYWILFAPLLLETRLFAPESAPAQWITQTMEQKGGLLAGLARFYRGLDHIYGFGYPLQLYDRDERKKFLASVYSVLAHGTSRSVYTSPEVAGVFPLRTSNLALQKRYRETLWNWDLYGQGWMEEEFGNAVGSEPLSAGAGMALQLIRKLLIDEELDSNCEPTGRLELLRMAPSKWLEDGKKIGIENMPTAFGAVNLNIQSQLSRNRISGQFVAPSGSSLKKVSLWLRHPSGRPIKAVVSNGQAQSDFTADSLVLPASGTTEFEVEFQQAKETTKISPSVLP
jgi:hypothetical protein